MSWLAGCCGRSRSGSVSTVTEPRISERRRRAEADGHRGSDPRSNGRRPPPPAELARRAAHELAGLLGREAESVVGLQKTDDGWCIDVEVLDVARIPSTADILAEYAVDVDRQGHLLGYRRVRRYARGRTQDDS
jgi:hypothetical protein